LLRPSLSRQEQPTQAHFEPINTSIHSTKEFDHDDIQGIHRQEFSQQKSPSETEGLEKTRVCSERQKLPREEEGGARSATVNCLMMLHPLHLVQQR
jgi:hypothetical protein